MIIDDHETVTVSSLLSVAVLQAAALSLKYKKLGCCRETA